ncbi:MAG: hypothetical protein LQ348_004198 [Seirophora lacunosa]|nr:MAG: hypothetical protein LQ348_004198 [Seirophora lacunosa]
MAQSSSLSYQIHLEFLFACDRTTILRDAYAAEGLSPWNTPDRNKLDRAALEHLALILSGYNARFQMQEVRVATRHLEIPRAFWSVRLGTGKEGMELYGRQYGTETPFKRAQDAHVCCVQLVSPAFNDTEKQWTSFATATQRIVSRLSTPGTLHPRGSHEVDRINHLAWTNKSCSFTVTVQPNRSDTFISWPTLQNLYAAWGSSSEVIQHVQNPRPFSNTVFANRRIAPANELGHVEAIRRVFTIPSLAVLMNLEAHVAAQVAISRMSILVDGSREKCTGVRFDEHRGTLDVEQIQFWTRLTHQALVACQNMAAAGRKFRGGASTPVGFARFSELLIHEQWVRDHARKTIRQSEQGSQAASAW